MGVQGVEVHCSQVLQESGQLEQRRQQANQTARETQGRVSQDRAGLEEQREELHNYMDTGRQLVHNFLQEELRQDVPTGGRSSYTSQLAVKVSRTVAELAAVSRTVAELAAVSRTVAELASVSRTVAELAAVSRTVAVSCC